MKRPIYTVRHSAWCQMLRKNDIPTKPVNVWLVIAQAIGAFCLLAAPLIATLAYFDVLTK